MNCQAIFQCLMELSLIQDKECFNQIFVKRNSNVNYVMLEYERIVQKPTYDDWLQILEEFELWDCFVDPYGVPPHRFVGKEMDGGGGREFFHQYGLPKELGLELLKLVCVNTYNERNYRINLHQFCLICTIIIYIQVKN